MQRIFWDLHFLTKLIQAGADMSIFYRFGPLICQLQDLFSEELWNIWHWKLDAYEIHDKKMDYIFLSVNRAACVEDGSDVSRIQMEKLSEERSGFFNRQVFKSEDGDTLWKLVESRSQMTMLAYQVSRDWSRITILEDHTDSLGQAAFEYMSRMVLYAMIPENVISFHGVLMEYEKQGIILSAPSGTGKTTHARSWRDIFGAFIINGDNACCYQKDGVWTGFGIPWSGTSGEHMNRQVRIKAMVVLRQAAKNQVTRLSEYEAFAEVLPMLHCPVWDQQMSECALNGLEDFLSKIPIYLLDCRPDQDAALLLKRTLEV